MFRARTERTVDGVTYTPDGKFRVIAEGASLSGWAPHRGGGHVGWRQDLHVGDVVTCTGYGPGWGSDPGYGVEFTTDDAKEAGASNCQFRPGVFSVFNYRPQPGYLDPIDD